MRPIIDEILIFSAFQADLSLDSNLQNHDYALNQLDASGISYKVLDGVYKGVTEKSILVIDSNETRLKVEMLCNQFSQECFLRSDSERDTYLVYPDGNESHIGTLQRITKSKAETLDGYSIDLTDGSMWAAL